MYLALYRKWRPKTFADVIGQEHITTTLKNEIEQNRLAHSYLFTGSRGTGKTTCSKILSMAINCDNPVNGNPCMVCENCKGIENGSTLDVVEIDAASNNGVDNIRELRDEASYTPAQCKYRVYILDEVHMLSSGAFNALLKIMEDPPAHLIFILATTEAHKVPPTILSRCQRFDFHRIKSDCMAKRLLSISNEESSFTLNEDAANLIARISDGAMRDALSLLDQCISSCPITSENEAVVVDLELVTQTAGMVTQDYLFNIATFILNGNASDAVKLIDELYTMSKDLQSLVNELILYFRNIMLTQTLKNPADLVLVLPNELEQITALSEKFSPSQILYYITQLQDCMSQMAKKVDRRLSFELCLVRLCTPSLSTSNDAILARLDSLEVKLRSGEYKTVANSVLQVADTPNVPSVLPVSQSPAPQPEAIAKPIDQSPIKPQVQTETVSPSQTQEPILLATWAEILEGIKSTDSPLWGVLHGSQAFVSGSFLLIRSPLEFISGMLKQEGNATKLLKAVFEKTGVKYKLRAMSIAPKSQEPQQSLLSNILSEAKNVGVIINQNAQDS